MNNFIHVNNMTKAVLMIIQEDNIVNAYGKKSRQTSY